jgi:hypothetical protein
MKRNLPATPAKWLEEIEVAITDAAGEPFARLIREPDKAVNLFHLDPMVCMKFRGLDYRDEELRKKVTEGALATYVANSSPAAKANSTTFVLASSASMMVCLPDSGG